MRKAAEEAFAMLDRIEDAPQQARPLTVDRRHHEDLMISLRYCTSMWGIKADAIMSNSVVPGRFRDLPNLRAAAFDLMGKR